MSMMFKGKWRRVLDIAATLGFPPEKGRAWVFPTYPPHSIFHIKLAFRLLSQSAKHCVEAASDLWWGLKFLVKYLKNVSKNLPLRLLFLVLESWDSLVSRQSQGQTSRYSCLQSDSKTAVASSGERPPLQALENQQKIDVK